MLLELHRYDVEVRVEDRGLVPLALLDGTEDTVECYTVTSCNLPCDVILHETRCPLGLGTAPESLGTLLDLDLLGVDVHGVLVIQDETCGLLVAATIGIGAHHGLLEDHSRLGDPHLASATSASEQGMGHTGLDRGDLPCQTLHCDHLAEVVRPEVPDLDLRITGEVVDTDIDRITGTVYVRNQGHHGATCLLYAYIRIVQYEHREIDVVGIHVGIIDLDTLLLWIVVSDVGDHDAVCILGEDVRPGGLYLVLLEVDGHSSDLPERHSSSAHQIHPPFSMEISPLIKPVLRNLVNVFARSSGHL